MNSRSFWKVLPAISPAVLCLRQVFVPLAVVPFSIRPLRQQIFKGASKSMTGKPHCPRCTPARAKMCEFCSGKTALMAIFSVLLRQSEISDQVLVFEKELQWNGKLWSLFHSAQSVHQHPRAVVSCGAAIVLGPFSLCSQLVYKFGQAWFSVSHDIYLYI